MAKAHLEGGKMAVRQAKGKFAKGHCGGPGRPPRAVEEQYLIELRRLVPLPAWGKVVTRALADAINGNAAAREWLSKYVLPSDPVAFGELAARLAELEREGNP